MLKFTSHWLMLITLCGLKHLTCKPKLMISRTDNAYIAFCIFTVQNWGYYTIITNEGISEFYKNTIKIVLQLKGRNIPFIDCKLLGGAQFVLACT